MKKKKYIFLIVVIVFIVIGIFIVQSNNKHSLLSEDKFDTNKIWVGTFQLVWNEFMDTYIKNTIEFQDGNSELATELNKRTFTKEMLSEEDYYIAHGRTTSQLKEKILSDINNKFNINGNLILNGMDFRDRTNNYTLYAMLNKSFSFPKPFDKITQDNIKFNGGNKNIKLFGIKNSSSEELNDNVKVMFYNTYQDFGVRINTIENEELILYRTNAQKTFDDLYNEVLEKESNYKGSKKFEVVDELRIPYIKLEATINYSELCNREIKNTDGMYIKNAVQNIKFTLTERGGNLISEAGLSATYASASRESRYFYFTDTFILFLKEKDKEQPYFALMVDSDEILESFSISSSIIDSIKNFCLHG